MSKDVMSKVVMSGNTNKAIELVTFYRPMSIWYFNESVFVDDPLPFCLKEVNDWYVKWDSLHVQHTPDSKWVEYDPHFGFEDEHEYCKHPDQLFLDGEEFVE